MSAHHSPDRLNVSTLLTLSRLVLAPVLLLLVVLDGTALVLAAAALLACSVVTDLLDGHLARSRQEVTALGGLLDPLADAFVFLSLFFGFVARGWMPWWLFAIVLYRELLIHGFLRQYMLFRGIVVRANVFGKLKTSLQTVVAFGVLGCMIAVQATRGEAAEPALRAVTFWGLLLVAFMSVASLSTYLLAAVRTQADGSGPGAAS